MKYCFPDIDFVFDTEEPKVNTIIIENPALLRKLIEDIRSQIDGFDGKGVLSEGGQPLRIDKKAELLDRFYPFSINSRTLLSKVVAEIEKKASESMFYSEAANLVAKVEEFLYNLFAEMTGDIDFERITVASLMKATTIKFCEDYDWLPEKIIDYMELVTEYVGRKLFFTLNLRSFLTDKETELFMQTVLQHRFHCIMIECYEKTRVPSENRIVIDETLCEIY